MIGKSLVQGSGSPEVRTGKARQLPRSLARHIPRRHLQVGLFCFAGLPRATGCSNAPPPPFGFGFATPLALARQIN